MRDRAKLKKIWDSHAWLMITTQFFLEISKSVNLNKKSIKQQFALISEKVKGRAKWAKN